MSELVGIITSSDPRTRDRSLDTFCLSAGTATLLAECEALERFRRTSNNLYERVRAQLFLYAIHRFHLPRGAGVASTGRVPFNATLNILRRRFEDAAGILLQEQAQTGPSAPLSSALAAAYHDLAFQTLATQVRHSVRAVRGNQWMSRTGHPADYPLAIRAELLARSPATGLYPILRETTPVRMDLTHSGWSDIFFLGMDFPEGARVLNISIDLAVAAEDGSGEPNPPVEAYFRVIDEPVLRLTSVDLNASAEIASLDEVFDFARDYLGLLKAALIASGIVPQGLEGARQPLADLLAHLAGAGRGIELVSRVREIPKGSRLAVSTNLLACLIAACMRATRQIHSLTGGLPESDRRLVAARAILGEWLGGSGGGWQDSGGVWPGIKIIEGVCAAEGDPEFGISRGRLLPRHHVFGAAEVSPETRRALEETLVLVHGGMAQDVGPILEMVTEKYLLRSEAEWQGRREAMRIFDEIVGLLRSGDVASLGPATQRNFFGPIQTIIPWATNRYTETLIDEVARAMNPAFRGFWMLGGMAGGGMGFMFRPEAQARGRAELRRIMLTTKRRLENAVPFAMDPVVYNFHINDHGTQAVLMENRPALMPPGYYTLTVPALLRVEPRLLAPSRRAELDHFAEACRTAPELSGMVHDVFEHLMPRSAEPAGNGGDSLAQLLEEHGFDRVQHERIQADLRAGRIGLAQNRLPASTRIEDVSAAAIANAAEIPDRLRQAGLEALARGEAAVVSLAGGAGTRWTRGAGTVKALNPFCKFAGRHRSFIEVHLAKSRRTARRSGTPVPHIVTTSYLTHEAIEQYLAAESNYGYEGPLYFSPGRSIGLRLVPAVRDLRFAWQEMPQQILDEQKQKVRESLQAALISWAQHAGEASDYTDNLPMQCLHPTGHWYEIPNMLRNGVLARLLEERPALRWLMVHNIDTVGAHIDPAILGWHIDSGAAMSVEVIARHFEDRGGGLARVDGRARLVEGLALPNEEVESCLSYYNSNTMWIDIARLLDFFGLTRSDLADEAAITDAVRRASARVPTYITIKDVKKRWGKGQEDIFPVAQFEKLWGDMTALPELNCRFVAVSRARGQQLKEPAQLDAWLRDGSAAYVDSLCDWG